MTKQGNSKPERPPDINLAGKGYALWLVPEEPMFSLLADRIAGLSLKYSTPRFDPHVTLLSRITGQEQGVRAKSGSLVKALKPVGVELGAIGYLDEYYRCLFFHVIPAGPIVKAHQTAQEAFRVRSELDYMPHLSLVYGNLELEMKKGIAAEMGSLSGHTFELGYLKLYRVSGNPDAWKCIEEFELR